MATLVWTKTAEETYYQLRSGAETALRKRLRAGNRALKAEGLFKQVKKTLGLLASNPHHPGLQTHKFAGIENPYDAQKPVFEAYAQNKTPGAYRVFWCYGPQRDEITIIAITPHP